MKGKMSERVLARLIDAAMKERFFQLARKYDPRLVFEIWTPTVKAGGVRAYFGKDEWEQTMTVEQVLNCLDDYCSSIESLLRESHEEGKGEKEMKHHRN